ncbi:Hpt domain-containing protein [Halotia wernerae UHCC 0503]|nr:Hpt domain-containing protein [Halotia wernerae UHCC 0503]
MPKQPLPSQMIRVPTALIESVRELSRLHRAGHTKAILHGLQQLISSIDSTIDIETDTNINQLVQRISQLESQNQAMSDRMEKLEVAYNNMANHLNNNPFASKRRSQSSRQYQHQPTRAKKAQTYDEKGLAERLKVDVATLRQKSRDYVEFTLWCRKQDPSGLAWELNEADGLYHLLQ